MLGAGSEIFPNIIRIFTKTNINVHRYTYKVKSYALGHT